MHDINRSFESRKVTLVGAIVNLILSIGKVVFGIIGQSQALIADGVHSISDLLSDVLVWFAAKHAGAAPDEDHPYGHGRYETAATLGLGIFLIIIAASIILDAVGRLFEPASLLTPTLITLVIAIISILSKEILYWYTLLVAKKLNSPMLQANAWHHRTDAISSIIVLLGIAGTMAGLPYLDAVAAVLVGVMIGYIGWKLGIPALEELVDKGIEEDRLEDLKNAISTVDGVQSLHMLRTRKHGNQITADLHIQVEPFLSVSEGHMVAVAVENAAKNSHDEITDVTVHIDPEDDEISDNSRDLPNRGEALTTLKKALAGTICANSIEKIQLHYLDGRIHADFYLPLNCLDNNTSEQIQNTIDQALYELDYFDRSQVYFSNNG